MHIHTNRQHSTTLPPYCFTIATKLIIKHLPKNKKTSVWISCPLKTAFKCCLYSAYWSLHKVSHSLYHNTSFLPLLQQSLLHISVDFTGIQWHYCSSYFFSVLAHSHVLGGLFGNTQNKGFGFSSGLGAATATGTTGFGAGLGTTGLGGFGGFNIQSTQQQQGKSPFFTRVVLFSVYRLENHDLERGSSCRTLKPN